MTRHDLILNNGDLQIVDGDFVISRSDNQNIELILLSSIGSWKQSPLLGADISQDLNGLFTPQVKGRITKQLFIDGYNNVDIRFNTSTSKIELKING